MPERKAKDRDGGAYPQSVIIRRLEARAQGTDLEDGKQMAAFFDARPNFWTRRRNGSADLTLPEISHLAEHLAPNEVGFPFLDDYHRRALARGLAELAKEALSGHSTQASPSPARPARRSARGGR